MNWPALALLAGLAVFVGYLLSAERIDAARADNDLDDDLDDYYTTVAHITHPERVDLDCPICVAALDRVLAGVRAASTWTDRDDEAVRRLAGGAA